MSAKTKLDRSGHDVWIDVDLDNLMGQPIEDPLLRQEIGTALRDKIEERVCESRYRRIEKRTYSEDYRDSLPYRVSGKTGVVNLKLTGDMIDNLGVIRDTKNRITLGYPDELNKAKAFNHHTGDTVPVREFMYLTNAELADVKREFASRISQPGEVEENSETERLQNFLGFLRGIF